MGYFPRAVELEMSRFVSVLDWKMPRASEWHHWVDMRARFQKRLIRGAVTEGERHILRVTSTIEWPGSPGRIKCGQSQRRAHMSHPHPSWSNTLWTTVLPTFSATVFCKAHGTRQPWAKINVSFNKLCLLGSDPSWLRTGVLYCSCPPPVSCCFYFLFFLSKSLVPWFYGWR